MPASFGIHPLRGPIALLVFVGLLPAQIDFTPRPAPPALVAVQHALLSGRFEEARALLAGVVIPPTGDPTRTDVVVGLALLEARLLPDERRLHALLDLAEAWPERSEAVTAAVAATSALVRRLRDDSNDSLGFELRPDESSPPDDASTSHEASVPDEERATRALYERVARCLDALRRRHPQDPRLDAADQLFAASRISDANFDELVIAPGTPIPVPTPLAMPHELRIHYWDGTEAGQERVERGLAVPARVHPLGIDPAPIEGLGPGRYLLDLRSAESWRAVATLRVSGVDLALLATPCGVLAVAARDGRPARDIQILIADEGTALGTAFTGSDGLAIVTFDRSRLETGTLRATAVAPEGDRSDAVLWLGLGATRTSDPSPALKAHLVVDRPLYRPGETVLGRVAVVRHEAAPLESRFGRTGFVPATVADSGRRLQLELKAGSRLLARRALETDDDGIAAFSIPLPPDADPGRLRVDVVARAPGVDAEFETDDPAARWPGRIEIVDETPAAIAEFKRPPLVLDVEAPETWEPGTPNPAVRVRAALPSGVPAGGLRGRCTVSLGSWTHSVAFMTNEGGTAEVVVDLASLDLAAEATWLRQATEVVAPDGQTIRRQSGIAIRRPDPEKLAAPTTPDFASLELEIPREEHRGGAPVGIRLTGPPKGLVVVAVARETLFAARTLRLGDDGRAALSLPTDAAWFPEVTVVAALIDPTRRAGWGAPLLASRTLRIEDPVRTLSVELATEAPDVAPRATSTWQLRVRDGSGHPVAARVSFAVVDERLFLLAADRTRDPRASLRPEWERDAWRFAMSEARSNPWNVLGRLLHNGRVVTPGRGLIGKGGGAGGGASGSRHGGGSGGDTSERSDFRPTAFFDASITTGPDGRATVSFPLPDDLTTWRITAIATSGNGGGGRARGTLRTRKVFAVEPILPRFLREGDHLTANARVVQTEGAPTKATLSASASGGLEPDAEAVASRRIETRSGGDVELALGLRGTLRSPAELALRLADADGAALDALRVPLPVLAKTTSRRLVDTAVLDGGETRDLAVPMPIGGRRTRTTLEIVGDTDAVLRRAAETLLAYPYGCAEQTASRLVPVLLSAHARLGLRSLLGGGAADGPLLTPEQAHRLETGFARLRALRAADGGFRWWDGDDRSDPAISAIVFRTLALAAEAGIPPERYGLPAGATHLVRQALRSLDPTAVHEMEPGDPFPSDALAKLSTEENDPASRRLRAMAAAAIEVVAAALELAPDDEVLIAATLRLAERPERLPSGLLARLAHALPTERAASAKLAVLEELLLRLDGTRRAPPPAPRSLLDSPASALAATLRLLLQVKPDHPARPRLVAALLRHDRAGLFDHTAGTAATLLALAEERAATGTRSRPVPMADRRIVVEVQGKAREFEPLRSGAEPLRIELPADADRLVIRAPEGTRLVASVVAETEEEAEFAAAVSAPYRVRANLARLRATERGEFEAVTEDGPIVAGELLQTTVEIEGPPEIPYLLVSIPLPAGAEVVPTSAAQVVRDDRVTVGLSELADDGRAVVRIRWIAGLPGDLLGPPVTVEAMYDDVPFGRSTGGRLVVRPRPAPAPNSGPVTALGAAAAATELARRIEAFSGDEAEVLAALRDLDALPLTAVDQVITSRLPALLGRRFAEKNILRAWLRVRPGGARGLLEEQALDALLEVVELPANEFLPTLARLMAASGDLGAQAAIAFAAGPEREAHRRLLGLVVAAAGAMPPDVPAREGLAFVDEILFSDPLLADPELARERFEVLAEPRYAAPLTELLWSGIVGALADAYAPTPGVRSGAPSPGPAFFADLIAVFERAVLAFETVPGVAHAPLALVLSRMGDLFAWEVLGAAEPAEHAQAGVAFRAAFRRAGAAGARLFRGAPLTGAGAAGFDLAVRALPPDERRALVREALGIAEAGLDDPDAPSDALSLGSAVLKAAKGGDLDPAVVLRLAIDGPAEWKQRLLELMDDGTLAQVPTAVLVEVASDVDPESRVLRASLDDLHRVARRGVAAVRGLAARTVAKAPLGGDVSLPDAIDTEVLRQLDLDTLTSLVCLRDGFETAERTAQRLEGAPIPDAVLASTFRTLRGVAERGFLFRLAATRPGVTLDFDADDPAAERWTTLLAARRGDAAAVRKVLAFAHGDGAGAASATPMPDIEILSLATVEHADPAAFVAALGARCPTEDLRRVLDRAETPVLANLLRSRELSGSRFAEALSERAAARLAEIAVRLFIAGEEALPVVLRAPGGPATAALLPRIARLSEERALELAEELDERRDLVRSLGAALLAHPSAKVRATIAPHLVAATGAPCRYQDAEGTVISHPAPIGGDARRTAEALLREAGSRAAESAPASVVPWIREVELVSGLRW